MAFVAAGVNANVSGIHQRVNNLFEEELVVGI